MLTSDTNSQGSLTALLILSVGGTAGASLLLYYVLLQIETNTAAQFVHMYAADAKNLELEIEESGSSGTSGSGGVGSITDLDSSMNSAYASIDSPAASAKKQSSSDTKDETTQNSSNSSSSTAQQRVRISQSRKAIMGFLTLVLCLLDYLLLVRVSTTSKASSAFSALSLLGLALVSVVALHAQILDEIRRGRGDRLAAVVTLLLVLAMSLNLATYATKQVAVEDLYQGPARIVGYDTSRYDALQSELETTKTRSDLEVAWGAAWACPRNPDQQCRAKLDSAVCEMDGVSPTDDDSHDVDQQTTQVYYDKDGNEVSNVSEQEVLYDKKGHKIETVNYDDSSTYNPNTGKVQAEDSDYQDSTYYQNGTKKEDYVQVEEISKNEETGGQEDIYEEEDVNYDGKGGYQNYDVSVDETETNAKGQETDETYYYGAYDKKDANGEQYDAFAEGQVKYGANGQVQETYEAAVDETGADGTTNEEVVDESITYDKNGKESYNVTEEDVVYDANDNIVQDTTEEYDSNGNDVVKSSGDNGGGGRNLLRRVLAASASGGSTSSTSTASSSSSSTSKAKSSTSTSKSSSSSGGGSSSTSKSSGSKSSTSKSSSGGNNKGSNNNKDSSSSESGETLQQELQDEENENEELEKENEQLKKQNEELQDELKDLQGEVEDEEEEIEEVEEEEEESYYDDDAWWSEMDWGPVWGDYQCFDMFEADLEGKSYDETLPPGQDEWPYLNVYGNCRTCEAYLVDYYTTQHFKSIRAYKEASRNYGIAASLSLLVTLALALKQRWAPVGDNQIDLLQAASVSAGTFA